MLSITTNVAALGVQRTLSRTAEATNRSLERLSSGSRINRAADDAAGLAISEGLRSQLNGMTQAVRNTQDGVSVLRVAEGTLGVTASILQRMRDLSVQAANDGALDGAAKAAVQTEIEQLKAEVSRIAGTTTFNGTPLLDGTYDTFFQVGANVGETVPVVIGSPGRGMDTAGLGLSPVDVTRFVALSATIVPAVSAASGTPTSGRVELPGDFVTPGSFQASYAGLVGTISYAGRTLDLESVDFSGAVTSQDHISVINAAAVAAFGTSHTPFVASTNGLQFYGATPGAGSTLADAAGLTPAYAGRSGATRAIGLLDAAIGRISSIRAYLGAVENRFQHAVDGLAVSVENTSASVSRIRDTDMATEMTVFTRNQVLTQAGTAMLAQTNRSAQGLLALLG